MEEDGGAIHPVDVGLHGVKRGRRDILKAQVHLHIFMKQLHCPAKTIPQHDVTSRRFGIITGQVLAATIRSFFGFRAHQVDFADVAEIAHRVSYAKFHSLALGTIRHDTNGGPLQPAMIAKERGNVTPLS